MMVNQLCSLHFEGSKTAEQANNNAVTLIAFFNSRARGDYAIFILPVVVYCIIVHIPDDIRYVKV
jgi:hypothetical protein